MTASDPRSVASAIWRIESPKLIASLTRMLKSVDLAEEIAQEAFVEALQRWETSGVPDRPGAWLSTAAKHRALDVLRHARRVERKHERLAHEIDTSAPADFDEALDDVVGDDLLRLVFVACRPILPRGARRLTLRCSAASRRVKSPRVPRPRGDDRAADHPREAPLGRSSPFELRVRRTSRRASGRSWRSSTWCSTRATRRRRAATGCARLWGRAPRRILAGSSRRRRGPRPSR